MGLPRVRVVVVNWNGREDTLRCLDSLERLDWPAERLEVVVVDNGSTDGLVELVRRERPHVRVVEAGRNLGFAAGCNVGMGDLDGVDHVALLNNDAEAEPGWLRALVDALEADERLGAATSKVVFRDRFVAVDLRSAVSRLGALDPRAVGVRLAGVRVDGVDRWRRSQFGAGWWGLEHDGRHDATWSGGLARLWVPLPEGARSATVELSLSAPVRRTVEVATAGRTTVIEVDREPAWHGVSVDGAGELLVDNAGTVVRDDWYGVDRGHLEPAARYDEPAEVDGWYGGAVLLRGAYLEDVGRFDERLFMYYEDTDLSWRGRDRGWRYRYVPTAVVRHQHSASSVEGSRLAQVCGERNRLVVLARNGPLSAAAGAALRFVLATLSYARRDLAAPLLRGEPPRVETVRRRLAAFAGFLQLLPHAVATRRGRGLRP